MRGFAARPDLPSYEDVYGLRAAAIAVYPMYKGLASLVGMDIVGEAQTLAQQIDVLRESWNDYDFFFIHYKYTDSTGEDGNFSEKVRRTEDFDAIIPRVRDLRPERRRDPASGPPLERVSESQGAHRGARRVHRSRLHENARRADRRPVRA